MNGIRKGGNANTNLAATDATPHTCSTGLTGGIAGTRKFTSDFLVISVAGATNITIWDGPSATGVIRFGPFIIGAAGTFIFQGLTLEFWTSVVFQTSGAVNSTVTIAGEEK